MRIVTKKSKLPQSGVPDAICLTERDAERLTQLVEVLRVPANRPRTLKDLERKLNEAELFKSPAIARNVVTMNSTVRLKDLESGEQSVFTLTFPHGADLSQHRISVLTPVGTALLGRKVGHVLECKTSSGLKRFRIEKILYQPEAAKDYDR